MKEIEKYYIVKIDEHYYIPIDKKNRHYQEFLTALKEYEKGIFSLFLVPFKYLKRKIK